MPGNRLAFPVGVRPEVDGIRFGCGIMQLIDHLFFPTYYLILRLEFILQIYTELALREILDVADRSHNHKIFA
jgi:hypothetical protein